jgi:predicted DNA-binding transcriptional regulator YafY
VKRGAQLAASFHDGHLALRRVERRQALIERLHAVRGELIPLGELARDLGVSARTVARDVERLRLTGVPIEARRGRGGGVRLLTTSGAITVVFDLPEVAALVSSLAVLGPRAGESAASAMRKLTGALRPAEAPAPGRTALPGSS